MVTAVASIVGSIIAALAAVWIAGRGARATQAAKEAEATPDLLREYSRQLTEMLQAQRAMQSELSQAQRDIGTQRDEIFDLTTARDAMEAKLARVELDRDHLVRYVRELREYIEANSVGPAPAWPSHLGHLMAVARRRK